MQLFAEMTESMGTKLGFVAERAKRDKAAIFDNIRHHINEESLKASFQQLKKECAVGTDGISWKEYGEQLDENIKGLMGRIKKMSYRPQPVKRVYIPKDNGEQRPIGIPAIEDKMVQKAMSWANEEKTQAISFGRYEKENAQRQGRKANTFDFLGITHYIGTSRWGKFKVGRKTSKKRFRRSCVAMNRWLAEIRNKLPLKEWWKQLIAKMNGHYAYYGISDNFRSIGVYYCKVTEMVYKWLNRRSQKKSMNWEGYKKYLERYPLPKPRIVHRFYVCSV